MKNSYDEPLKPLVSLALSAYNEESILQENLEILYKAMQKLEPFYNWEIILIDDGSSDQTGIIAKRFAQEHPKVSVYHHLVNKGLGQALQKAFALSKGDYIITFDIDLSCSPSHIEKILKKLQKSKAKVVIASPNMKGGKMTNVPPIRHFLSLSANWFLSKLAPGKLSNLTCMVRGYEGQFLRSLDLRSKGMEIMPEIIYKTMIMKEKIVQIPAHLDWTKQNNPASKRRSSMRIFHHTISTLFTGFLLRPFLFFILPGLLIFLFAIYPLSWMFVHFFQEYAQAIGNTFLDRSSEAIAITYMKHPHTVLIGFLSLILSVQLIAFGFLSLQSKHYFEETYNRITKLKNKD